MKKVIEFEGISSGDYECHCFDVTYNEFESLTGEKPGWHNSSIKYDHLYKYYPEVNLETGKRYRIKMEIEEI